MRHEDKLKEKVGTKLPYTVPEGYFTSFKERMMNSLPEYPEKPKEPSLTVWQRIRPYVYLAAMFAGIWCMMQIFHRVSTACDNQQDRFAEVVTTYDPDAYDLYIDESMGEDLALEDEVINLYPDMDDLKRDFYAQI